MNKPFISYININNKNVEYFKIPAGYCHCCQKRFNERFKISHHNNEDIIKLIKMFDFKGFEYFISLCEYCLNALEVNDLNTFIFKYEHGLL